MNILGDCGLVENFLEIFHGVGAVVGGEGAGLTNGVHVPHVSDGGRDMFVLVFYEVVDFFIGGVGLGDQVLFVEVGVIGPSCIGKDVPKPLKAWEGLKSRPCKLRATDFITIITMSSTQLYR